jgi:hypothetical protein
MQADKRVDCFSGQVYLLLISLVLKSSYRDAQLGLCNCKLKLRHFGLTVWMLIVGITDVKDILDPDPLVCISVVTVCCYWV